MRKLLFLLFFTSGLAALAQTNEAVTLQLVSPLDYEVFQRQTASNGSIIVECILEAKRHGALTNLDQLQARLVDASADMTKNQWQPLPFDDRVRHFRAELPAIAGGWYRLEVRLLSGKTTISEAAVEHVGVGEIFVVAGQSNAANHGEGKQHAQNPLVVAFGKDHWQPAADPEPGASGTGGSFMPAFGHAVAERMNEAAARAAR